MQTLNRDIAAKLRKIFTLMQLAGENRFRAIAFDRAAQAVENLGEPIENYIDSKSLTDIKGIGKSIAEDIYAYSETGKIPVLEELSERVPQSLVEWLDISGLGPKSIVKIYETYGITEMSELKEACLDGRVASLPGMGKKSAEKIVKSIEWLQEHGQRSLLSEALDIAEPLKAFLEKQDGVRQIEVAGSLRRRLETIGDVDLLVAADGKDAPSIFDAFIGHPLVVEVLGRGETKSSVRTESGRQVDLRIVSLDEFPAALLYFTGSKEHNVALRQRARKREMTLNEYGLFGMTEDGKTDFDRPVPSGSEEEIYRKLDLYFVPPELREDRGEIELFETNESLPLVEEHDIRGVVHSHSTWSDGKFSIEEMARAAIERGYTYLTVTDHSRTAAYAGGLTIPQVKKQWEEIDGLNQKFRDEGIDFTLFKGIESDILPDGSLDYPDEILAGFDIVIASVHQGLDMPAEAMTERFMKAIEHPHSHIIGHPTGRLLLRRGGSELDLNKIIDWAAQHGKAIEINANPHRLDMDWRFGGKAREVGLLTSINPDAHSIAGIDQIRYGVMQARKAMFEKERVLNTRSAKEFRKWLLGNDR